MKKSILILFTESRHTKWKECVNMLTIIDVCNGLKSFGKYDVEFYEFAGFSDTFLNHIKKFDLVFNICYGLYKPINNIDISQDDVVKWLDENNIKHTTTKYKSHRMMMDKSIYSSITEKIEGLYSPKEISEIKDEWVIKKPKFGSCGRDITLFKSISEIGNLDENFIYQEHITGREFSVAVIPDKQNKFKVLKPAEIISENNIYTVGNKKTSHNPIIDVEILNNINKSMCELHDKFDLVGITRTDLKLGYDGKLYLLDINAMPNIDKRLSLIDGMIENSGLKYNDVLESIVESVIE